MVGNNAHLESFGGGTHKGDASSAFVHAAYDGLLGSQASLGETPEYLRSIGGAAADQTPAGVDEGSWGQISKMIGDGKNVQFTTAGDNQANNNAQPDYILGADGVLRANPAKTTPPSPDGKINIQVGDATTNAQAAKQAAQQLQVAAVQEKISYWRRSHPNDTDVPDFLKGELNTAQTAAGGDQGLTRADDQAFNRLKFPDAQGAQITNPDTNPTGGDVAGGGQNFTPAGYDDRTGGGNTGGYQPGGFENRGGFNNDGYFKGRGDASEGTVSTGGAPIGPGEQAKAKDIYDYFVEKGFTEAQASGILGNIQTESSFNTASYNRKEGAIGICQWEGTRRTELEHFAREQGKPVTDLHVQLDFVMHEFATSEKGAYAAVKAAQTPEAAAQAFQSKFERSAALGDRPANARHIYAMFKNGGDNTATV